jgi:hypothetical protein
MAIATDPATLTSQVDMMQMPGLIFIAGMGVTATNPAITGCSTVYAATAGEQFAFINSSDGPVSIVFAGSTGPLGSVTAFRIA